MPLHWTSIPELLCELAAQASNLYVGYRLAHPPAGASPLRKLAVALATALAALCILLAFHVHLPLHVVRSPLSTRVDWLLCFGLLYGIYITACVLLFTLSAPLPFSPARRRLFSAAVPGAVVGYGVFIERHQIQLVETDLPIQGLPIDLQNLRIVQISDIHYGPFFGPRQLDRVVSLANECRPHIALFTGDLITTRNDPLDDCIRRIAAVRADSGSFGCHGNHEFYSNCESYASHRLALHGIRILRQESQLLRFGASELNLAGVDYQASRVRYLEEAPRLMKPGALNVLLSHTPDVFPVAAAQSWNLTLAGHTHGGQIGLDLFGEHWTPRRLRSPFVRGAYRLGPSTLFVSCGLGTIGAPVRIGAPPEVNLIRLTPAPPPPSSA